MPRRQVLAVRLTRALVTDGHKIQNSVKKPVHRVEEVDLAKQVNWFFEQSFRQHKFPQILFRRANGPKKVSVGHALRRTFHSERNIPLLKLRFPLVQQPITEVAIYLAGASSKFI